LDPAVTKVRPLFDGSTPVAAPGTLMATAPLPLGAAPMPNGLQRLT